MLPFEGDMFVLRGVCPWFGSKRVAIWTFCWLIDKGVLDLKIVFCFVGFMDSTKSLVVILVVISTQTLGKMIHFDEFTLQMGGSTSILSTTWRSTEIPVRSPPKNVCTSISLVKVMFPFKHVYESFQLNQYSTIIEFYLAFNQGLASFSCSTFVNPVFPFILRHRCGSRNHYWQFWRWKKAAHF